MLNRAMAWRALKNQDVFRTSESPKLPAALWPIPTVSGYSEGRDAAVPVGQSGGTGRRTSGASSPSVGP